MTTRIRIAYRCLAVICIAALIAFTVRGDLPLIGGGGGATTQRAPGFVPPTERPVESPPATEPSEVAAMPIPQVTDEQVGDAISKAVEFLLSNFDQYQLKRMEGEGGDVDHAGLNALCVYALLQAQQATRDPRLNLNEPFMKGVLDQLKRQHLQTQLDAPSPVVFARAMRAAALAVNNRTQDHAVLADDVAWLIRAHRDGAYTDDDNFGTPRSYTDPPPPPSPGYSMIPTAGVGMSGKPGQQPNHTQALPSHYKATASHSPGASAASSSAPPSKPDLAPSKGQDLGPSKIPDLRPSEIPDLRASRIPDLSPSRIVLKLPTHICIPGHRGVFLNPPSTQPHRDDPAEGRNRTQPTPDVAIAYPGASGRTLDHGDNVPYPWDAANSQFGLLGVWAGAEVGIEVPSSYWQAVQYHWLKTETEFGTWSYSDSICEPSIGPTWAGDWALLVTHDWLGMSQRSDQLGRQPYHPGLTQALKYLETDQHSTTIKDEQTNFVGYNLFMLERIGQASGYKFFGSHDWYREVAGRVIPSQWPNGAFGRSPHGYDAVVQTAYTLIFLASGRNPIFMEKLRFDGAWANRPRDIANLTRFASRELERTLNWEVVPLNHGWTDWLDSPVLYVASHEAPGFKDEDLNKLRSYVQAGGVLFTDADAASPAFTQYVQGTLAPALFPQYAMQDIPQDDPIYSIQYKLDASATKLRGISNGSRWLLVHSPVDLGSNWQTRNDKQARKSFELAVNLFVYASGKTELHNRLATTAVAGPSQSPENVTRVIRLKYQGNWDPEPYAWRRADQWMQANADRKLDIQTIATADLKPGAAKLAVLTGNTDSPPTDTEIAALKAFVESGGWLLVDDCGGAGKFAGAVETQWLPKITTQKFQPIAATDPVMAGEFAKPRYRDGTTERTGASYKLLMVAVGKGRIIYSPVDITTGLLGANTAGILGYQPASAMALAKNVILESSSSH